MHTCAYKRQGSKRASGAKPRSTLLRLLAHLCLENAGEREGVRAGQMVKDVGAMVVHGQIKVTVGSKETDSRESLSEE